MTSQVNTRRVRIIRLAEEYGSLNLQELQRIRFLLRRFAVQVHEPVVVLDLRDTGTIGAAFIGILAEFNWLLRNNGKRLMLCSASRDVHRLLRRTALTRIVDVYPTRADALRASRSVAFNNGGVGGGLSSVELVLAS